MFVLMSMLIISFGLWGIGDMLKLGGRNSEVAHVGGTHIPLYGWLGGTSVSVEEVRDRFNRQLEQIQRFHRKISGRQTRLHHAYARWRQILKLIAERNAAAGECHR